MPNWCTNHLTVTTRTPDELRSLMVAVEGRDEMAGQPLSFARYLPVPEEMRNAPHSNDPQLLARVIAGVADPADERTWRYRHWGTGSDACYQEVTARSDTSLTVCFSTAWSPGTAAIVELGERFPTADVTLIYYDQSNDFAGKVRVSGGRTIEDTHLDGDDAGHMLDAEGLEGAWHWEDDEE